MNGPRTRSNSSQGKPIFGWFPLSPPGLILRVFLYGQVPTDPKDAKASAIPYALAFDFKKDFYLACWLNSRTISSFRATQASIAAWVSS